MIAKLRSYQMQENELCNYEIDVPLFRAYCISVEIKGPLEVEYVFNRKYINFR